MKKRLVMVVIAALGAVFIAGCNNSGATTGEFAPNAKVEPGAKAPAPAP